jgi:hypothetical protein
MILADTGFLVGVISEDDQHHRRSIEIAATIPPRYITTWPCLTEALYLLGIPPAQERLRRQIEAGILHLYEPNHRDALRAFELMRRYADAPMDFADASMVVAAEVLDITRILTFDRHFYAYRINGNTSFEVLT